MKLRTQSGFAIGIVIFLIALLALVGVLVAKVSGDSTVSTQTQEARGIAGMLEQHAGDMRNTYPIMGSQLVTPGTPFTGVALDHSTAKMVLVNSTPAAVATTYQASAPSAPNGMAWKTALPSTGGYVYAWTDGVPNAACRQIEQDQVGNVTHIADSEGGALPSLTANTVGTAVVYSGMDATLDTINNVACRLPADDTTSTGRMVVRLN